MRDSARNIVKINSARNEEQLAQDLLAREAEEELPVPIQPKNHQAAEADRRPEAEHQEEPDQDPETDLLPEMDPEQEVLPQDLPVHRDIRIPRGAAKARKPVRHTGRTGSAERLVWY